MISWFCFRANIKIHLHLLLVISICWTAIQIQNYVLWFSFIIEYLVRIRFDTMSRQWNFLQENNRKKNLILINLCFCPDSTLLSIILIKYALNYSEKKNDINWFAIGNSNKHVNLICHKTYEEGNFRHQNVSHENSRERKNTTQIKCTSRHDVYFTIH